MNQIIAERGDLDFLEPVIENGHIVVKTKMRPKATPRGVGFIDQLSFTFLDDFMTNSALRQRVLELGGGIGEYDEDLIVKKQVGALLRYIFGLEVHQKRLAGLNFYRTTWTLSESCGMVSIGGQAGTILIQITGIGMSCAKKGWERRLREFAMISTRFVLTRVDCAYDDYEAANYSVDRAAEDYDAGHFTMKGRPPSCEQRGNWRRYDGKGRTFYVGRRENGKMVRTYEKGRQLGDENSEWVRIELELHNKDRVIPLDIIDRPGDYLAGSYSAFEWMASADGSDRIATIQKVVSITYDAMLGHLRRSYGGLLKVIFAVEPAALNRLEGLGQGRPVPKRLDLALMPLGLAG